MTSRRMNPARVTVSTALAALFLFCVGETAVPLLISYQGRLTAPSGAPVPDTDHSFVFSLYADSVGGAAVWTEAKVVPTTSGLFSHLLGSVTPLNSALFLGSQPLFLEVTADGEIVTPRTRLASVPFALASSNLDARDSLGRQAVKSFAEQHQLVVYDSTGSKAVTLRGTKGDSSVVLPDSAINSFEILDEPGIAGNFEFTLVTLNTGEMTDLVTVDITTPADGFIVLHGKGYVLLSGTTGPNQADIQIDEDKGGDALFPYYTRAGLSGYVNTGINYFPIYVTRIYYKAAGTYTFRMEGRANYPLPAEAKSWDHILTAVYYPTSYDKVGYISNRPINRPGASSVIVNDPLHPERNGTYYEIDLHGLDQKSYDTSRLAR